MKCIYYLVPDLASARQVAHDLHGVGMAMGLIHVISHDDAGLRRQQLHAGNTLETTDLARDGLIGAGLGVLGGFLVLLLAVHFDAFGGEVSGLQLAGLFFLVAAFGAWVGSLAGRDNENAKIRRFHDDIEAGRPLVLAYVPRRLDGAVRGMMQSRHPAVSLVAVDRRFFNPFAPLRRRASTPSG